MNRRECGRCGRIVDADGLTGEEKPGRWVSDGEQWADEDCRHCHLCLYEECEVCLRHSRWVCRDCTKNST